MLRGAVLAGGKVAEAFKRESVWFGNTRFWIDLNRAFAQDGFHFAMSQHMERFGVEVVEECFSFGGLVGGFGGKKAVEHTHFSIHSMRCRHPMNGSFHLASVGRIATAGKRGVGAMNAGNIACSVFFNALASNEIGITQTHFLTG